MKLPDGFIDDCMAGAETMAKIDRLIGNRETFIAVIAKLGVLTMRTAMSFSTVLSAFHDHLVRTTTINFTTATAESLMLSFNPPPTVITDTTPEGH